MDAESSSSSSTSSSTASSATSNDKGNNNSNKNTPKAGIKKYPTQHQKMHLNVPPYSPSFVGSFLNYPGLHPAPSTPSVAKPEQEEYHEDMETDSLIISFSSQKNQLQQQQLKRKRTTIQNSFYIPQYVNVSRPEEQTHERYIPQYVQQKKQYPQFDYNIYEGYIPAMPQSSSMEFSKIYRNHTDIASTTSSYPWSVHYHDYYGCYYYYNCITGESTWQKPAELINRSRYISPEWSEHIAPSGRKYYYNNYTLEYMA